MARVGMDCRNHEQSIPISLRHNAIILTTGIPFKSSVFIFHRTLAVWGTKQAEIMRKSGAKVELRTDLIESITWNATQWNCGPGLFDWVFVFFGELSFNWGACMCPTRTAICFPPTQNRYFNLDQWSYFLFFISVASRAFSITSVLIHKNKFGRHTQLLGMIAFESSIISFLIGYSHAFLCFHNCSSNILRGGRGVAPDKKALPHSHEPL